MKEHCTEKLENMTYVNQKYFVLLIITAFVLYGCSYSFTGASVPKHLSSIAIPIAVDRSGSGEPDLSNNFTNELIQKFLDDNNLDVTDKTNANALLECSIVSLQDRPETVSGTSETATQRRITINIKVTYKDLIKKKTIFDKNFSNYSTYDTTLDPFSARKNAIQDAVEILAEDILLGVVSNW